MKFSIIICGYNEEENLDACLQSCLDLDYDNQDFEIIYVDNNSTDKSLEIAKKYPVMALLEKRQGPSEARNCGIAHSNGENLLFLDSDLKIDRGYLKTLDRFLDSPEIGAYGGMVKPLIKTTVSRYLGVSLFEGYPRYVRCKYVRSHPSCNLMIKRKVLDEIGFFKENLLSGKGITRFSEDKEICERIRGRGYKILYIPDSIVQHKNTHSLNGLVRTWIKGSKGRLNMIRIGKKDPFTLIFKSNLPILYILLMGVCLVVLRPLGALLLGLGLLVMAALSIKAYLDTRLVVSSLIVKPILDPVSTVVINLAVLYYRTIKNENTFSTK